MSPLHKATNIAEQYDMALHFARNDRLPADAPRPRPTSEWPAENLVMLERYRDWLIGGGRSVMVTNSYDVIIAGHVLGLALKPYQQLDLGKDLERAMEYIEAKQLSSGWNKNCRNSLKRLLNFLRVERGLGEARTTTPFDIAAQTRGLPAWLVSELERYEHILQRNWRPARLEQNIRSYWCKHLRLWRFLCRERGVQNLADVNRKLLLDFIDRQLVAGSSSKGLNSEMQYLHGFLVFLQQEGYMVPQALLRIPVLKEPDPLPRFLTDEQVKKLRDEVEREAFEIRPASYHRDALLVRAAFYLLWQGGLRLGEMEELRMEDLDIAGKKITVRRGKGLMDRTVYLTGTIIKALQDYLAVRGAGSGDHVFLYRNAPLQKDLIRNRLKIAGKRVNVKVYPHKLRHTCATQLLNAGCRVTSIQRFLGHKNLSSTLIYARAHDQTVADDYFTAMQRVEQRLEIVPPESKQETRVGTTDEIDKEPKTTQLLVWVERLALPELCQRERLEIAEQLKHALSPAFASQLSPPMMVVA